MTIKLTIAQGDEVKVHAAGCADLSKAPTKRAAYNGIFPFPLPDGSSERDAWVEYNQDFLEEGGADAAWPLVFLPCCASTGLLPNSDRTWSE